MRNRFWILLILSFSCALALAGTSFVSADLNRDGNMSKDEFYGAASDTGLFPDLDTNDDALVDETEYNEGGVEGDFDAWDLNEDSYLDTNELYDGVFAFNDQDKDGYWDAEEWDDATERGIFDVEPAPGVM